MKPIYLEPDEEITSVIEKMAAASGNKLAMVVPKNSSLFQSLVNLKLIAKQAKELDKEVVIISSNKVGQRLAKEVGLNSYNHLGNVSQETAETALPKPAAHPIEAAEEEMIGEIKVNRYVPPLESEGEERPVKEEPADNQDAADVETEEETEMSFQNTSADEQKKPEKAEPEAALEPSASHVAALPPVVNRSIKVNLPREPLKIPWKSVIIATALLVFSVVVLYLFLPQADVKLSLPSKPVAKTLLLSAKTTPDGQETTVAGSSLSASKSVNKAVNATGKKNVGTKATGTVTITNKYRDSNGVGQDQSFTAGTIITDSKTKKTFSLNQAVAVGKVTYNPNNGQPIYQSKNVGVTATAAGEDYNISATTFTISGGQTTEVSSSSAFTGGTTKQVTVLAKEDLDKAYLELEEQAITEAKADIVDQAKGQKLLDGSLAQTIKDKKADQAVDAQVESATASLVADVTAIVFDEKAALEKLIASMQLEIGEDEQLIIPEGKQPTFTFKEYNADKTSISFEATAQGFGISKIDKSKLAKSVANHSFSSAQSSIQEQYNAEKVEIEISPSWWPKRLPLLSGRIGIDYDFSDTTN